MKKKISEDLKEYLKEQEELKFEREISLQKRSAYIRSILLTTFVTVVWIWSILLTMFVTVVWIFLLRSGNSFSFLLAILMSIFYLLNLSITANIVGRLD